ncbi:SusC/RagA family TonB-linked outer membrane protein [Paraflavitalea sp. CAU 1676]|uniref:SusC/RagA family TonB-linked outer membrane protein n=1 Tax=Paraflavitalea sp. CAU 1676 TaxID=3032598 RepID=UPI0023D9D56F|nr:SusC/RagA family TonB-linked outer membrane protein [Paraflavitalea sp. CAU 1676]MDF2188115.1 SusC/RagA family TonB-linked outer membrane protein [Paraflavitalea sp. CAU 1676]
MIKLIAGVGIASWLCLSPATVSAFASDRPLHKKGKVAITVTGTVKDAKGTPLPSVSVQVKDSPRGTYTDARGAFSIEVTDGESILVFSATGLATQELKVGTQTTLSITMQNRTGNLDEVVVVGYGKQRKGDVTSSIGSVKAEDFTKGFARDAGQLIQGKVAGVAVVTASGDPNSTTQISLRGNSTIFASTQPLVLIDGIPGALNTVAPEDIEAIDVLKDGSAAAIYGTRGTNGVVLITTRKKGSRPATVNYEGQVNIQTIARKMEFLDADGYRQGIKDGIFPASFDKGTSTDWLDVISRNPVSHTHNLSLQGGNAQTNYIASVNVRQWQGFFKRSENEQLLGRVDVNHSMLDNKLKFNLNIIGRNRTYFAAPNYAYIYRQAIIRNPTDSVYNAAGFYREDPNAYNYDNPLRPIMEVDGETVQNETRYSANVIYSPIKGLNAKLLLSTVKQTGLSGYAENNKHRASETLRRTGYASRGTDYMRDNLMEITADYTRSFNQHRVTLLGGYSWQSVTNEGFGANNSNFPTDLYSYNVLQSGDALLLQNGAVGMSSYKNNYRLIGFFARANYVFDDKYMVMLSLRNEGSTKFGENYKRGSFPGASIGWRINREDFMANATFINDLKLRAGVGVTGTTPTASYLSLISMVYSNNRFLYNGQWIQPIEPARNPNPDLRWEKKTEYNVGLDFAIWKNRISGSLDWYQRNTVDMLYDFPVPVPPNLNGFTTANAGEMKNTGFEVLLNAEVYRTRDFEVNANLTWSYNKNTLVSISSDPKFQLASQFLEAGYTGEPIQTATHRTLVGGPVGMFYGYRSIDVDENGGWIIEGEDGKPKPIKDAKVNDKKYLGNGIPKHTAGLNLNFRYKKLDLAIGMRGAFDYQILNFQRMYYENPSVKEYNMLKSAMDLVYGKKRLNSPLAYVSHYIEDGDHWKIDNVTLGYNVINGGAKYLKNLRVYVSTLNLVSITGYKGLDPEVTRLGLDPGNDSRDKYPTMRTFTLGLNMTF